MAQGGGVSAEGETPEVDVRVLDDMGEVVARIDLVDISLIELAGRRRPSDPGADEGAGADQEDEDSEYSRVNMDIWVHDTPESFRVRTAMDHETTLVQMRVEVMASYAKAEPFLIDESLHAALLRDLALMSLYPFIRQHFHDLSTRLGDPTLLGLIRRDQVEAALNGSTETEA